MFYFGFLGFPNKYGQIEAASIQLSYQKGKKENKEISIQLSSGSEIN